MIVAVTGHRPDKLGGYIPAAEERVYQTALRALELLRPEEVITGMAMGWDQAIARACFDLKIPYIAAVPFRGQEVCWRPSTQLLYKRLLKGADKVVVVSDGAYAPFKMHRRNHWMVDNCDTLLALYNGDEKGGTAECVQYAMKRNRDIVNAWRLFTGTSDELISILYERPNLPSPRASIAGASNGQSSSC